MTPIFGVLLRTTLHFLYGRAMVKYAAVRCRVTIIRGVNSDEREPGRGLPPVAHFHRPHRSRDGGRGLRVRSRPAPGAVGPARPLAPGGPGGLRSYRGPATRTSWARRTLSRTRRIASRAARHRARFLQSGCEPVRVITLKCRRTTGSTATRHVVGWPEAAPVAAVGRSQRQERFLVLRGRRDRVSAAPAMARSCRTGASPEFPATPSPARPQRHAVITPGGGRQRRPAPVLGSSSRESAAPRRPGRWGGLAM